MYAVEQVCGLYGVQVTREQSRHFTVQGVAGRWRPMFFGQWTDAHGKIHRAGKADFLARPRVRVSSDVFLAVPLWIECKSKDGRLTSDQVAFKFWVESNGDAYMMLREDVRPLVEWFELRGVTRHCDDADLAPVVAPLDATVLITLPCRWCGLDRKDHKGVAFGCPLHLRMNDTKLIGKVWSPDLKKAVRQ